MCIEILKIQTSEAATVSEHTFHIFNFRGVETAQVYSFQT